MSTIPTDALAVAAEAAADYLRTVDTRGVAPTSAALAAMSQLTGPLADGPTDATEVVRALHAHGSPATMASAGGRFFGLVVGGTLPAALGARVLAGAWDQIVFDDVTSPIGCALERCAGRWVVDLLGLPVQAHVSFVTGATMGNFSGLAAARHHLLTRSGHDVAEHGIWGAPRPRVVASAEAHVSVEKVLRLLGWGNADVERVPTDAQGRIVADALPQLDANTIVCLQAGNVNSGAFDPFAAVCARARAAGAWVHVDGAFGLWVAASAQRRHLTAGVELADSWSIDAHKWLNTPYDCGMAIVRDATGLRGAMANDAAYLGAGSLTAPKDTVPELSRGSRGVEVWAALRSLGRNGVAGIVDRTCAHATTIADGLRAHGFEILNDVELNQVLAAIGTPEQHSAIATAVQESGECWFGQSVWKGRSALRISVANWHTDERDIRRTIEAIVRATDAVLGRA